MKTIHCVEYEQQCVTCHKTCWERVCEDHVINCVKYVPETRTREVCYTVCKPCWETKTRTYTVCKPCWETKSREVCYTVCKPGVWSQRPVMLQQLALLKGFELDGLDPAGPEFIHLQTECAKLAFADREKFYGDPKYTDIPIATNAFCCARTTTRDRFPIAIR